MKFKKREPIHFKGRTFGFEMTGLIPGYYEADEVLSDRTKELTCKLGKLVEKAVRQKFPNYVSDGCGGVDGHCIEIPSPKFTTWGKARNFYQFVKRLFRKHGITPHNRYTVCGGNHLHFGVSHWAVLSRILRIVARHPEIAWVFTQPDDTDSANSIFSDAHLHGAYMKIPTDSVAGEDLLEVALRYRQTATAEGLSHIIRRQLAGLMYRWDCSPRTSDMMTLMEQDMNLDTKIYSVECHVNATDNPPLRDKFRIEFRCVEAPRDEQEFVDQVDFFHRLVCAAEGSVIRLQDDFQPIEKLMTCDYLNKIPMAQAEERFRALCVVLGVNPARYQKYIRRNLRPRWELGRKRL